LANIRHMTASAFDTFFGNVKPWISRQRNRRMRAFSAFPTLHGEQCLNMETEHAAAGEGSAAYYGSFKQSKMFAAGVTCSDCHEPHGATLG
jgi:hypothetical protein